MLPNGSMTTNGEEGVAPPPQHCHLLTPLQASIPRICSGSRTAASAIRKDWRHAANCGYSLRGRHTPLRCNRRRLGSREELKSGLQWTAEGSFLAVGGNPDCCRDSGRCGRGTLALRPMPPDFKGGTTELLLKITLLLLLLLWPSARRLLLARLSLAGVSLQEPDCQPPPLHSTSGLPLLGSARGLLMSPPLPAIWFVLNKSP